MNIDVYFCMFAVLTFKTNCLIGFCYSFELDCLLLIKNVSIFFDSREKSILLRIFIPKQFYSLHWIKKGFQMESEALPNQKVNDKIIEEPSCRLRTLNEDCLCKIFDYLGTYEYVQLNKYNEYFGTIIQSMVIKRKMIKISAHDTDVNETFFKMFGDSLRHIEVYSGPETCEYDVDDFVEIFQSHLLSGTLDTLSIVNKCKHENKLFENHMLHMLSCAPNLKKLIHTDKIFDCGRRIVQCCPKVKVLDINYHDYNVDYFANFANLTKVSLTSTSKTYHILNELALKNTIEELKITFDFIPKVVRFAQLSTLKYFEICSNTFQGLNLDFVEQLLPMFNNLEKLTIDSKCCQLHDESEIIRFFELAPWIKTYSIRNVELQHFSVAIHKFFREITRVKSQRSGHGAIKPLHLILNRRQWHEIQSTNYEPFIAASVQPSFLDD